MSHRFKRLAPIILMVMLAAALAACAPAQSTQAPAAVVAPTQAPAATEAAPQAPAPTDAPPPPPAATTAPIAAAAISYAKDVQPIFDQNCVKCHSSGGGKKGGLSLETYADVMKGGTNGQVITPGDAAKSVLVQAIVTGEMPMRAPKLAQSAIDTISAWVAAGAQNN